MTNTHEKRIIGGIVAGHVTPSALGLETTDFSDSELAACYAAARKLESDGIAIDAEAVASKVADNGIGFLSASDLKLMALAAQSSSVVHDAVGKVRQTALRSFLLRTAAEVATREDATGQQLLDMLRSAVASAEKSFASATSDFVWLADLKDEVEAVYRDLYEGVSYSVPTFFESLDRQLNDGFSKGDLHIVCGFTGQGKSALALNFARNQAKRGHKVGIVSREMSAVENVMRLQAADSGVPRWQVRRQMFDKVYEDLTRNLEALTRLPIALSTKTETVEHLRTEVARMVDQDGLEILYVDYLQLMHSKRNASRAEEVAAVSRTLKMIAMETKIPVVALCQFNRGAVTANKFDLLSYLKESSGIEQDASTILFVKFDKDDDFGSVKNGCMTVLKNRNGVSFSDIPVTYRGELFTFEEAPYGMASQ